MVKVIYFPVLNQCVFHTNLLFYTNVLDWMLRPKYKVNNGFKNVQALNDLLKKKLLKSGEIDKIVCATCIEFERD